MMTFNPTCKSIGWEAYRVYSTLWWSSAGAAATNGIIAGIVAALSSSDYNTVQLFLQNNSAYLLPGDLENTLTRLHINQDLISNNEGVFKV